MKQQPENPKKRKIQSDQIKAKLKIKPMPEQINNTAYIYGLLKKKNQSFILTNERLLMIKGIRTIGYARSIPNETFLPFKSQNNIPKMKVELELSRIQNVIAQNQMLTVEFIPEANQPKWEFVCESKLVAGDWKKLILDAVNDMKMNSHNLPIQVNLPENGTGQAQNGFRTPEKNNGNNYGGNIPNQNYSTLSNSGNKIQLPVIIEQHQDNETEHPQNRDSFPLGRTEEIKQPPSVLNLTIKQPSSDTKPLDLKQQYIRKKKQEERMKDSLVENNNLLKQSTASNKSAKNDKKILDCNWDYEFLKGESEHIIVERFKVYLEDIIRTIIDELSLEEKRRQYKPIEETLGNLKYEVGGVSLEIAFLQLNEVSTFQDRSTIVSSQRVKLVQQQFKNSNYILQITRNRGRFRVPLMMLSEYKGFTVLAKANVHSSNDISSLQSSIQQDIAQLQRDTKVSRSLFEDQENLKVIAADQKFFEKLSRSQNKFKKFDVCFLTDINYYLPQDFFAFNRAASNLNRLRPEMLQDEEYDELMFNGSNLNAMLSRVKVPTETRDAINLLTDVSKSIPERVAALVQEIEGLDRPLTNSEELSELLHLCGLNMRYLGLVFDNAKETWLKAIILSEIVARSAKYFLRYDLQDSTINLAASSLQNALQYQTNQVLGWLNRIFGIGNESESLWRQIFRQAQTYFKCSVSRDNLNVGFLLQALEHHGKFRLKDITLSEAFFKANNIFNRHHFAGFILTSKTYDLSFTDHYSLLNNKMQDLSYESYEQVRSILNLQKREGLESHYFLNNQYKKIILYLIHWLSPAQAPYLYKMNSSNAPSLYFYEVQSTAIKWQLKAGRVAEAEKIKDWIVEHVNRWLGECHPVLSQLFDIFSRFYLNNREQEKRAVSYSKNSLKNQQKLLGGHHIKLADAYYNLGEVHLHYAKKVDALQCFKRASQILTDSQATLSQPFVQIALKVSQLYLANNVVAQALQSARQAQSVSEELKNVQQYLSSAQLIGRCYEISEKWLDYIKFVTELIPLIPLYKDSVSNLQRMLKVIFFPIFQNIASKSRESCKALSSVLSQFQQRIGANSLGYSFIKTKIQEKIFPSVFLDYLDNIELLLRDLSSSNVLTRWRGFQNSGAGRVGRTVQFLAMLQALNCFLSGNFVEGIFAAQQ